MPTDEQEHWQVNYSSSHAPTEPPIVLVRRTRRFSIVTAIIAVNVGIFALQQISGQWHDTIYGLGALQASAVVLGLQYWRLITAQYLHASFLHLLLNMMGLHFLGRPLEQMWSARKFFTVYTVCGLAGNIFFTVLGATGQSHLNSLA